MLCPNMAKVMVRFDLLWPINGKLKPDVASFCQTMAKLCQFMAGYQKVFKSSDNDNDNEKLCKYMAIYDADVGYF